MKEASVTLVQMNSLLGKPEINLRKMESFIKDNPNSDFICFPESCLSGYDTSDPFLMNPDDEAVRAVSKLSTEYDVAVDFGFAEKTAEGPFLRQDVVDGDSVFTYRKCHLGKMEACVFKEGSDIPVFDVRGIKVGIQMCLESRIPDVCATLRSKGCELVFTPVANGIAGDRRKEVWHAHMPARGLDNGMFVVACSAVGDNGMGKTFGGGIIAIGPRGEILHEYYGQDECAVTLKIGGKLPREGPETMTNISFYDRRRPELYR